MLGARASTGQQPAHELPQTVTTAAGVFGMPPEQAAKLLPVHLVGTVTYFEAAEGFLFVADASGSVFVSPKPGMHLKRGDLVDVRGVTGASFNTEVDDAVVQVVGRGKLPKPRLAGFRGLMNGDFDCQAVILHGLVRSADLKRASRMAGWDDLRRWS